MICWLSLAEVLIRSAACIKIPCKGAILSQGRTDTCGASATRVIDRYRIIGRTLEMVAALWDVLGKAANLVQIFGLHAVMLIAVAASLLCIPESKRECAKLERCSRRLRALLQWPAGCGVALLCSEMGGSVTKALIDAAGLVESYKKSTLWCRLRRSRSMANQLRNMQDVVDSYCGLLLFLNAHLLLQRVPRHHPLMSDTATMIHEVNDPSQSEGVQAVSNCPKVAPTRDTQKANDIGDEGTGGQTDNIDPAGHERSMPASDSDFPSITVHRGDCSQ